ncbi:SH3 domain-containing protein [Nostoc sp. 106C]|uniref:SH3 domain-containing protein n=1 Tax=Nostoc sp. 106C TaxID=1932667 RepID=UPI000B6D7CBD|nr:SH3 domain-containing protein [Nostoc sp. 106C]OUL22206.1 ligand-binding protein SH3 [Nostoc sp. RF31YmG]OUL25561.1 ligand-binding protein SH3 [Nostoc sp. 106C]
MKNQALKLATGLALICTSVAINTGIANQMVLAKSKNPEKCNIYAYVNVSASQALNVRSGASSNNKVLGQVPVNDTVQVVGFLPNWAKITNASGGFKGTGWVSLAKLGLSTRGYGTKGVKLYAKTNQKSQVIVRVPPNTNVKLLGCQGGWALVEYKAIKGWLVREDQCGAALTSCS